MERIPLLTNQSPSRPKQQLLPLSTFCLCVRGECQTPSDQVQDHSEHDNGHSLCGNARAPGRVLETSSAFSVMPVPEATLA
jgi:hypothetical protein